MNQAGPNEKCHVKYNVILSTYSEAQWQVYIKKKKIVSHFFSKIV